MTVSVLNTTQERCPICHEDYEKGEIRDIDKTVQLVCGHTFHNACQAEYFKSLENRGQDLTCCCCLRVNVSRIQEYSEISKQVFQSRLKELQREYAYDTDIIKTVEYLKGKCSQIFNEDKEAPLEVLRFVRNLKDLWINGEINIDEFKLVTAIIESMFTGKLALKDVREAAKRWIGYKIPEKIKQEGILVKYSSPLDELAYQARISVAHLILAKSSAAVNEVEQDEVGVVNKIHENLYKNVLEEYRVQRDKRKSREMQETLASGLLGVAMLGTILLIQEGIGRLFKK